MIRLATDEDLKSIMNIINDVKEEMKKENNPQWHADYPLISDFQKDMDEKSLYVLEENNDIVGLICIQINSNDQYQQVKNQTDSPALVLHRLAISPKFQKKGYAQKLFQFAEETAIKNNIFFLKADTEKSNKKMNQLFKKLNFTKKGTLTWSDNNGIFNYYEKKLGSDIREI